MLVLLTGRLVSGNRKGLCFLWESGMTKPVRWSCRGDQVVAERSICVSANLLKEGKDDSEASC